ncbi:MAG: beta-lactamase family protein [Flavobacteriales bacterium]|nr:beta-lactamase family protein [Flavobacteriales bacterium]
MRSFLLPIFLAIAPCTAYAQQLYFPPLIGNIWETVEPASLGWCTDAIPPLLDFIDANNSKAFIVLKDGRIAIEHYTGTFTQDSLWYWASAGKSLTAFLVGAAQADGLLDINNPSSDYLGTGWTSCTPVQEQAITVRHQLTMTTGLDDGVSNPDCTDPACLQFLAVPGTRWAYHNAPYTRLDGVIAAATGQTLNSYLFSTLTATTGIGGLYIQTGDNNVFYSKPRSMARFGLLALNRGVWNGNDILGDDAYFEAMTTPSQALNESYGYLWWLNGQDSFMVPGVQFQFPGMLLPNQPADTYNALGKNGQQLNVVPSMGLVVMRMGNPPAGNGAAVAVQFSNNLWGMLNDVLCLQTATPEITERGPYPYPIPASERIELRGAKGVAELISMDGCVRSLSMNDAVLDVSGMASGVYVLRYSTRAGDRKSVRVMIAR